MNFRDTAFARTIDDLTYERDEHLAKAFVYDVQIKGLLEVWYGRQNPESMVMIDEGCPND